jgi:uncharacterized protein (TIGR02722 family)
MLKYIILITFYISCAGTQYKDPKKERGSMEWGPKEVGDTVESMVGSMQNYFIESNAKPYVELNKIQNKTSEHIDTKMLGNQIATNLVRRKIVFVDRSSREDAMKEMALGMRGMVTEDSAIKPGEFVSPNFKLNGEITDNVRYVNGKKVQYIVVTLRLLKLSSGAIEWQDEKQFLKVSDQPKFGW